MMKLKQLDPSGPHFDKGKADTQSPSSFATQQDISEAAVSPDDTV